MAKTKHLVSLSENVVKDVRNLLPKEGGASLSSTIDTLLKEWIIKQRVISEVLNDPNNQYLFDKIREKLNKASKQESPTKVSPANEVATKPEGFDND